MKNLLVFLILVNFFTNAEAAIKLPKLISDGMVLQRQTPLRIWGWADAGEKVRVNFRGKNYFATTNNQGEWQIKLPAQQAGGPFTMKIFGQNEIQLENILLGDVWLCSGQSNMELWMGRLKYRYANEIATSTNANIRHFLVPDQYDLQHPQTDLSGGQWLEANPKNLLEFSGLAYFFAKELYDKYKIPIGIINAALGGSPVQAWISEEALKNFPSYYEEAQQNKNLERLKEIESRENKAVAAWYKQLNEKDEGYQQNWKQASADNSWKQLMVPGYWADTDSSFNGVVWFKKEIDVPVKMAGKPAKIEMGRIVDADSVFINGRFVGATGYQYPPRRYEFDGTILKSGKNEITIRLVNNSGRGGFVLDKAYEITTTTDTIDLKGPWFYKVGTTMPPTPSTTFIRWKPVGLYNSMIAPLTNYAIKGFVWYQGESNTGKPGEYSALLQTLINDWRVKWKQGNLPFLYVQLPNFMETKSQPGESNWAAFRQQQLNTLKVPNTAMAVAIDLGEWNDIHPENKLDVGHRLSLLARKIAYGEKNLVASGPIYQAMKKSGNKIILTFSNTGKGLTFKNASTGKGFAIAGPDKKFVWAEAKIVGNTIQVWNDQIKDPVAVRYGWADNPADANLYNKDGLPASPFTTSF